MFAKSIKAGAENETSLEGAAGRVLRYLKDTMLGDSFDDGTWETLEERLRKTKALVRVGKMMDEGAEDDDSVFDKVAGKEVEDGGASSGKKKKTSMGGEGQGSAEKNKKKKGDGDGIGKLSPAFVERLRTKGGNCEVLFEGQWYQARVAKYEQRGDKFLVHFLGGGADQDIWVGMSENRIRPKSENWDVVTKGEVGEEVEVRRETDTKKGSKWIAATILEVRDNKVKVLLTGSGATEWMAMTRDCMRKAHIKEGGGSATKKAKPPKPIDPEKERERLEKLREKEERDRLKEEREKEKAKEREEKERIKEEERQRKEAERQEKEKAKEAEREKKAAKEREKEAEKQREKEKQLAKEREKERQRELDREKERLKGVTEGVGLLERYEWLKGMFGANASIKEVEVRRWLQSARDYRWMLGKIIEKDDEELRVKVSWVTPSPGLEDEWIAVQHKGKIGTLNVRKKGEGDSKRPLVEPAQIPDKDKELLGLVLPSEGAGVSSGPIVFERDKGVPRASFTLVYTRELASLQRCYQVGKDSWAREDLERLKSEIEESHLRFHRSSVGQYVGGVFRPNGVVCMSCGVRSPGRGVTEVWKKNFCLCDRCGTQAAKGKYCGVCERVLTELDSSLIRCDKTGAWVHAACDALDDLALSTAGDPQSPFPPP